MDGPRIVIIGSGNVATHLARALDTKARVIQIYSRSAVHASDLASTLTAAQPISALADITTDADYYIIAVSDDSIADIAANMPRVGGIVAHTSGSVSIEAIAPASDRRGVFYPLQTFSKSADVDVAQVPFFTEGSDESTLASLDRLASSISGKVHHADSRQRAVMHIAAVFACNFTNHLWDCAAHILGKEGYTLDVLHPLLELTLQKAMTMPPADAQTGPARRGDKAVIEKHLSALPAEMQPLYRTITQSILNRYNININI